MNAATQDLLLRLQSSRMCRHDFRATPRRVCADLDRRVRSFQRSQTRQFSKSAGAAGYHLALLLYDAVRASGFAFFPPITRVLRHCHACSQNMYALLELVEAVEVTNIDCFKTNYHGIELAFGCEGYVWRMTGSVELSFQAFDALVSFHHELKCQALCVFNCSLLPTRFLRCPSLLRHKGGPLGTGCFDFPPFGLFGVQGIRLFEGQLRNAATCGNGHDGADRLYPAWPVSRTGYRNPQDQNKNCYYCCDPKCDLYPDTVDDCFHDEHLSFSSEHSKGVRRLDAPGLSIEEGANGHALSLSHEANLQIRFQRPGSKSASLRSSRAFETRDFHSGFLLRTIFASQPVVCTPRMWSRCPLFTLRPNFAKVGLLGFLPLATPQGAAIGGSK